MIDDADDDDDDDNDDTYNDDDDDDEADDYGKYDYDDGDVVINVSKIILLTCS